MKYPEEFMQHVKEVYPDDEKLHRAVEEGQGWKVDILLQNRISYYFSEDDILNATSLESLQEKARQLKAGQALYKEWMTNIVIVYGLF